MDCLISSTHGVYHTAVSRAITLSKTDLWCHATTRHEQQVPAGTSASSALRIHYAVSGTDAGYATTRRAGVLGSSTGLIRSVLLHAMPVPHIASARIGR
eukprot:2137357-Rhodomonas_salina.1